MTTVPSFYIVKAHRLFLNAYGDDGNVVSAEILEKSVGVTLRDVEAGSYPNKIDGVMFEYAQQLGESA